MCAAMSKDGDADEDKYDSSRCWFTFCEGMCVRSKVALMKRISTTVHDKHHL